MPSFRKMSPEEIAAVEGSSVSSRKAIADLYDDLVRDLTEGDDIELELEPDERRQTVMARLRAAAARRQPALQLEFKPSADPIVLHFMVPVLNPPPSVNPDPPATPTPPARPAIELTDMVDDQSQSLLNLRDTRDRRDYQTRNNRYDRRDRPHANRPGTVRVNRSNSAGRFQSSGRPAQPLSGRRPGSSSMGGPRNGPPSNNGPRNGPPSNNGPRNDRPPPSNNGPRNDRPPPSNNGPRNGPPSNGPRNGPPSNNGPRNDRPPPSNNGPRNGPPSNGPRDDRNGPRDDRPTDRPPSAPYNRQRQRRRPPR